MRDFIYAIKKAYEETYAEKIMAKKCLKCLKKESSRLSYYSKRLREMEDFLYENHWIFPDPFAFDDENPYSRFLSFMRYGTDAKGNKTRETGKGFTETFEQLAKESRTLLGYAKDAYSRHDYSYVISLYEGHVKSLKEFDKGEDTHVDHNMWKI